MDLSYYLDLQHLCNLNRSKFNDFFMFAYKVEEKSRLEKDASINEYFFKDEEAMQSYIHKSGDHLFQLIFSGSGEVENRIIPALWQSYKPAKDIDKVKFGYVAKESKDLHPNAKIISTNPKGDIWLLSVIDHYTAFRNHHINQSILSADCEDFLKIGLPNIILIKEALASYKSLGKDDKKTIISDLKKLDGFIENNWKNGKFPVEVFSKDTGVDASDESDKTKKDRKCKALRRFKIPGIGSQYCFLHIKISHKYRIHFYADTENKKVYIAYIGGHLPTADS